MERITNDIVIKDHIKNLEIKKNYRILDFGCGDGTYTFSFAKLLGRNGMIYALDSDPAKLEKLREKVIKSGLEKRIKIIQTEGELDVPCFQ